MESTSTNTLNVIDRVMWDLKQGDKFRYGGCSTIWECLSVHNADNRDMSVIIKSGRMTRTVKLYPYYTQKANCLAHFGDRWIEIFNT